MMLAVGCGMRVSSTENAGEISCLHEMDCPASTNPCVVSTCYEQRCLMVSAAANTILKQQNAGDCRMKVCDGNGAVMDIADEVDVPADDGNACTEAACKDGAGVHEPVAVGEVCGENGVCNGKGACGACLPADVRCDGNAVATCSEEGQWSAEACPAGRPICQNKTCIGTRSIAVGGAASCVGFTDGKTRCFGTEGLRGGDGVSQVGAVLGAVEVAVGGAHACARLGDGSAVCWGDDTFGQIGDGKTEGTRPPTPVVGLSGATRIALGEAFSCALVAGGKVVCWGRGDRGELGSPPPASPPPASKKAVSLDLSDALTGSPGGPASVVPGLAFAGAIALGPTHGCALFPGGRVGCFGADDRGQLGQEPAPDKPKVLPKPKSPLAAVKGIEGATSIALGARHACVLLGDGTARCWGENHSGQLGDGTVDQRPGPVVVKDLSGATAISLGASHSCALVGGGRVFCWGDNAHGQLGDGTTDSRPSPATVPNLTNVKMLAAGGNHTCVMLADGAIRCWGGNAAGQLGDGATEDHPTPVSVAW